jgi:sulfatase modifying factor 1
LTPDRLSRRAFSGFLPTILATCVLTATGISGCAGLKESRRAEAIGIEWVSIAGARFVQGDTFLIENPDALPLHEVTLADFKITRYETTYAQYDAFAKETVRPQPAAVNGLRGDRAVTGVDWQDAIDFCAWLGARLPSEGEWEYAAAGGVDKQLWAGTNDEFDVDEYVWHRTNSSFGPEVVGRKLPNRFGLYDMSGNVSEWIGNYYQYYPEEGEEPAKYDLETFGIRILRGGDYTMDLEVTRTYWRAGTLKEIESPAIGFRCARDAN